MLHIFILLALIAVQTSTLQIDYLSSNADGHKRRLLENTMIMSSTMEHDDEYDAVMASTMISSTTYGQESSDEMTSTFGTYSVDDEDEDKDYGAKRRLFESTMMSSTTYSLDSSDEMTSTVGSYSDEDDEEYLVESTMISSTMYSEDSAEDMSSTPGSYSDDEEAHRILLAESTMISSTTYSEDSADDMTSTPGSYFDDEEAHRILLSESTMISSTMYSQDSSDEMTSTPGSYSDEDDEEYLVESTMISSTMYSQDSSEDMSSSEGSHSGDSGDDDDDGDDDDALECGRRDFCYLRSASNRVCGCQGAEGWDALETKCVELTDSALTEGLTSDDYGDFADFILTACDLPCGIDEVEFSPLAIIQSADISLDDVCSCGLYQCGNPLRNSAQTLLYKLGMVLVSITVLMSQ